MRNHTPLLEQTLTGSFDYFYVFDLYYDGRRRLQDIPIVSDSFSLNENATAKIQQSGSFSVMYADDFGRSVSPEEVGDIFAPFGAVVHVYCVVYAGLFLERVLMGQYEITRIPSTSDEDALFQGQRITLNSKIEIEFKEKLAGIAEDRFDVPFAPTDLTSTYAEYARISALPIVRPTSLPDAPITRAVVYEEERIEAIYDLADLIGGIPHMTAEGALSMRPQVDTTPVDTLIRGNDGSIISIGNSLDPDKVKNRVAVRSKAGDQTSILATAEVRDGPLRTSNLDGSRSPFRRRTKFVSSDYVTTFDQGSAWAERELAKVSRLGAITVPVVETFNPLRERGDVLLLVRAADTVLVRVVTISRRSGATMSMTVEKLL